MTIKGSLLSSVHVVKRFSAKSSRSQNGGFSAKSLDINFLIS